MTRQSLLCVYWKDVKTRILYVCVHCGIIHNSQEVQANPMSINREMRFQNVVPTYNETLVKKQSFVICCNVDVP